MFRIISAQIKNHIQKAYNDSLTAAKKTAHPKVQ